MDSSRRRREVRALYERLGELLPLLAGRSPLFPGSLYEHRSRCGRPQCKCARGAYRHRLWCVSFVEGGGSRTRVVPAGIRAAVAVLAGDYRRVREARRCAVEVFGALLAACDALTQARCGEGRRAYARLVQGARGGGARPRKARRQE